MDEILTDLSPSSLVVSCENNLASWLDVFSRLDGAQAGDIPGLKRSITDIQMPFFNSIMETRLTPQDVETTIELVKADANQRKLMVLWWVGPSARPSDLANRLIQHGFGIDEDGPALAVELDRLNHSLPKPEGLTILPALDDTSWQSWCQAMMAGFEASPDRVDFGVKHWHLLLSRTDPNTTQAFTAWLDHKPVATSLLQLGGGVAGIYAVATIPSARRKGIGAQVTLHALEHARSMGYKIGVLESSEMGLPMYRSIGFREYGRITSYIWRPVIV